MANPNFFEELKRRNIYKVSVAYIVTAWVLSQVASLVLNTFEAPPWIMKAFLIFLVFGFPFALMFSWAFELTPQGLKRTTNVDLSKSITKNTGKKLNWLILGAMAITILGLVADRFRVESKMANPVKILTEPGMSYLQRKLKEKKVAVLPFQNNTNSPELDAFGQLISDYITQGLYQMARDKVVTISNNQDILFASTGGSSESSLATKYKVEVLIQGRYYLQENNLILYAQIVDAENGDIIHSLEPLQQPRENKMRMIEILKQKILGYWTLSNVKKFEGSPPQYNAYQKYIEGNAWTDTDPQKALEAYFEAYRLDSNYLDPLTKAAATFSNLRQRESVDSLVRYVRSKNLKLTDYVDLRFTAWEANLNDDPKEVLRIYEQMVLEYPNDATAVYQAALYNLLQNNPSRTKDLLLNHYPLDISRDPTAWAHQILMNAYFNLGEYEAVVDYARTRPFTSNMSSFYTSLMRSMIHLGMHDELDTLLQETINRPTYNQRGSYDPENYLQSICRTYYALNDLKRCKKYVEQWKEMEGENVEILFFSGKYQEALKLNIDQSKNNPGSLRRIAMNGVLETKLGNLSAAREWSDSLYRSENTALVSAWDAIIKAQLGEKEESVQLLKQAMDMGIGSFFFNNRQSLLKPLLGYEPYEELIRPKGANNSKREQGTTKIRERIE